MADEAVTDPQTENQEQTTSQEEKTWRDSLPEDVKQTVSRFTDEAGLAQGYHELMKLDSGKVKIPGDEAGDEERGKFYAKLGRPETPEGYEIKRPQLPEGVSYDETFEKHIRSAAHHAGLNQKQLGYLANIYNKYQADEFNRRIEDNEKLNNQRREKLIKERGEDGYKEDLELAKRAYERLAPDELKELMTAEDIEQDPILVKLYAKIWRETLDDKLERGEATTTEDTWKPEFTNSPEMYRGDEGQDNAKARAWFEKQGYDYAAKRWRR